jgi:hypothetical protein
LKTCGGVIFVADSPSEHLPGRHSLAFWKPWRAIWHYA